MIIQNHIRGRRRVLDPAKKARLCELVAQEGYSVEQAADSLDVSLRTVQRERRYDQDFDHEVRLALQQPADPLKLMEHASRTHWRAAAWLLERTNPEEFARKPVNMASAKRVDAALRYLQEAALAAIPPELHEAVYRCTQAALDKGLAECFPAMGEWNRPKSQPPAFDTPLANAQYGKVWDERNAAILSLKTPETKAATTTPPPANKLAATRSGALPPSPSANDNLSPKTTETTTSETTESAAKQKALDDSHLNFVIARVERKIDAECPEVWNHTEELEHPDAQEPSIRLRLLTEYLHRHRRRERRLERAAEKKAKAAKRRAEAQRRRAA
jgi:hypothetical protein